MQRQGSFAEAEYAGKKKQTRRDKFLAEMEQAVGPAGGTPRAALSERRARSAAVPLGTHAAGLFCAAVVRVGRWSGRGRILRQPGAARLCRDRAEPRPDPRRDHGAAFPALAGAARSDQGSVRGSQRDAGGARLADAAEPAPAKAGGTIVDATIIAAPSSTKNKQQSRDPEMHQTKKGNQWYFGMKAHIGVDVASGLVHTVKGTAANEADITQTAALLHGEEEDVFGDAGYTGADKRPELEDRDVSWNIAIKRSIIKALPKALRELAEPVERALSQVRAVVEHPFHIVKNRFRHKKLRYRGLHKNTAQLHTLFALANLVIAKKVLLPPSSA